MTPTIVAVAGVSKECIMFGLKSGLSLVFFLLFMGIINVMGVSREDGVKLKRVALEWSLAILLSALVL